MAKKRSPQGGGCVRQRKDGKWEGVVELPRDPGTGKRRRKSVYADSQKEVRQKLNKLLTEIEEGTYKEPSKVLVSQWLTDWEENFLVDVKPLTKSSYSETIRNHLKPGIGAVKLGDLSTPHIQTLYIKLGNQREAKPGLSPKTIKNVHGVLHKCLQQAVELGYIPKNPATACKLPRVIKKEIAPLDEEQSREFIQAIKGEQFEVLFLTALFTGMREGEIMGLTWDCVDFDKISILVKKQLQQDKNTGEYRFVSLKNDKPRYISIAPRLLDILKGHRYWQTKQQELLGDLWDNPLNLVFTDQKGANIKRATLVKHFKKIVTSMGISETRFHDLRHTYAVSAIHAGDDIKTVQNNLGHATAAFTLDVYGHVTEQMSRASADRMDSYMAKLFIP